MTEPRHLPAYIAEINRYFCGCGDPDSVWQWIFDYLSDPTLLRQHQDEPTWLFAAYVLDSLHLTEHGTSINGAWPTDKGKLVVSWLQEHGVDWIDKGLWLDDEGVTTGDFSGEIS